VCVCVFWGSQSMCSNRFHSRASKEKGSQQKREQADGLAGGQVGWLESKQGGGNANRVALVESILLIPMLLVRPVRDQ